MLGDQPMQPGDPGDPLLQPGPGQHSPCLVLELNIMVLLDPVISHKQQLVPLLDSDRA
jgi:hypothetical protein